MFFHFSSESTLDPFFFALNSIDQTTKNRGPKLWKKTVENIWKKHWYINDIGSGIYKCGIRIIRSRLILQMGRIRIHYIVFFQIKNLSLRYLLFMAMLEAMKLWSNLDIRSNWYCVVSYLRLYTRVFSHNKNQSTLNEIGWNFVISRVRPLRL